MNRRHQAEIHPNLILPRHQGTPLACWKSFDAVGSNGLFTNRRFICVLAETMIGRFRPIVIFLAALAVFLANAGWISGGSAMAHSAFETQSHASAAHHAGLAGSHQDDGGVKDHAVRDCAGEAQSGCEGEHNPSDPAQSCCGTMACHAAIATTTCAATVIAFARAVKPLPLAYGLKQQLLGRMDRPPRTVGA
jgi:hypothetical protein